MAQRSVDLHPEAIAEAQAAYRWYRERSETAAEAFLAELDRAVELISEGPVRWPVYLHSTRRFPLRRFPFSVVYREVGEALQVVAVAHGRRKRATGKVADTIQFNPPLEPIIEYSISQRHS